MAQYSPIGPIKVLIELQKSGLLGNYLFLLGHDVLAHSEEYQTLLEGCQDPMVILDNSVVELGEALTFDDMMTAATAVNPDCIILPDVMGDFHATQRVIEPQLDLWLECPYGLMKVPQGETTQDLVKCATWMHEEVTRPEDTAFKDYWGIPRWVANKWGSRVSATLLVNSMCEKAKIHLLGMSEHVLDDLRCCTLPNVMGIDSANPIVLGGRGKTMMKWEHLPRGDYWESSVVNETSIGNIRYIRDSISTKT